MGSSTENSSWGVTRNPWDLERIPGGSSGGSAAAVAADEAFAALGSDTGGSIRQPAALCGCVGLKPTYGRVSRYGLVAFASSLDQIGPFTKDVADSALMLRVLAGHDRCDSTSVPQPVPDYTATLGQGVKGLRIGLPKEYFIDGMDRDVDAAVRAAIKKLQDLGAEVVEISLPHTDYAVAVYYLIATAEASANLARFDGVRYGARVAGEDVIDMYGKTRGAGFGPEVKRRIILGTYALSAGYYDAYYLRAQKVRTLIRQDFQKAFENCDVIVTPTSPEVAFRIGEKTDDPLKMYLSDIFTISVNLAGICGVSLPCGFTKSPRLPIGLQVLGKPFGEETVLRVAHMYEQATEWRKQRPSLSIMPYEAVIGLEVHVQLKTKSKMFCGCATEFGAEPNTHVCPVCLGYPGVLPVMNEDAVRKTILTGLMIGSDVARFSKWDRKNYFYPDMPKNYQISQYDLPLCVRGVVEIKLEDGRTKKIGVTRAHLEEDVAKNLHFETTSGVDFNRAGTPLMEIVSEPDMRTAEDAFAYLTALKEILISGGISDCDMEKGQLRCDSNVSVRPVGQKAFGEKVEIKNMNTISGVRRALAYEIQRQTAALQKGEKVSQETRRWDDATGKTSVMRTKEYAHDYRYFPEPDLMPVVVSEDMIAEMRKLLAGATGGEAATVRQAVRPAGIRCRRARRQRDTGRVL